MFSQVFFHYKAAWLEFQHIMHWENGLFVINIVESFDIIRFIVMPIMFRHVYFHGRAFFGQQSIQMQLKQKRYDFNRE